MEKLSETAKSEDLIPKVRKIKIKDYTPPQMNFYRMQKSTDIEKGIELDTGIDGLRGFVIKNKEVGGNIILYDQPHCEVITIRQENIDRFVDFLLDTQEIFIEE